MSFVSNYFTQADMKCISEQHIECFNLNVSEVQMEILILHKFHHFSGPVDSKVCTQHPQNLTICLVQPTFVSQSSVIRISLRTDTELAHKIFSPLRFCQSYILLHIFCSKLRYQQKNCSTRIWVSFLYSMKRAGGLILFINVNG